MARDEARVNISPSHTLQLISQILADAEAEELIGDSNCYEALLPQRPSLQRHNPENLCQLMQNDPSSNSKLPERNPKLSSWP